MLRRLLLTMILLPLIELYLTTRLYNYLKAVWDPSSALVMILFSMLVSAILGLRLIKLQGFRLLRQTQEGLRQGSLPNESLLEGILAIVAGIALIVPGFLSDALALILLLPGVRPPLARFIKSKMAIHLQNMRVSPHYPMDNARNRASRYSESLGGRGEIIEAEIVKPRYSHPDK